MTMSLDRNRMVVVRIHFISGIDLSPQSVTGWIRSRDPTSSLSDWLLVFPLLSRPSSLLLPLFPLPYRPHRLQILNMLVLDD
uniref:Uncharacterized protein n=1 Tax=Timema monikensis TaxID=170555 RepID=A0A7R9EJ22_9NEOP|nr:unnamed protein product [Timema monikensis]